MVHNHSVLALDVGEKRIGVALGTTQIRIAVAYDTLSVDGTEYDQICDIVRRESVETVVVGYPRNQSGEATQQTAYVEHVAEVLRPLVPELVFQDESLTSVKAEEILKRQGKPYRKEDIDALAASLILQDYLETHHA
jgi:putative Holliday junction resolvase